MKGKRVLDYYFPLIVAAFWLVLSYLFSSGFSPVPSDTATTILERVIELDGVLLGFAGVMFSIFFYRREVKQEKKIRAINYMMIAFSSFIVSFMIAFDLLMLQITDNRIFIPVNLASLGAFCSSIYVVLALVEQRKEKE